MNNFLSVWKQWQVPKDYFLVREHNVSDYIYFIQKGVARIVIDGAGATKMTHAFGGADYEKPMLITKKKLLSIYLKFHCHEKYN